ncbi:hypothetical protein ONS96_009777 [Cadophora gregata f. sp. sojae]|nr:hypothetical protein ONS96_009777 [Cadophora gregata f. sp. sojae]
MNFTSEICMLFKFAENQLPVLTLMCMESAEGGGMGMLWAKTVMGADMMELERASGEMMGKAGWSRRGD